jgi:hypothetical protein
MKNIYFIIAFFLFVILLFLHHSFTVNKRCCEFNKVELDGVIVSYYFGKSGNVIELQGIDKQFHFFYKKKHNQKSPSEFGEIAKKGSRILKPSYSDTITIIDGEKMIQFELIDCCAGSPLARPLRRTKK